MTLSCQNVCSTFRHRKRAWLQLRWAAIRAIRLSSSESVWSSCGERQETTNLFDRSLKLAYDDWLMMLRNTFSRGGRVFALEYDAGVLKLDKMFQKHGPDGECPKTEEDVPRQSEESRTVTWSTYLFQCPQCWSDHCRQVNSDQEFRVSAKVACWWEVTCDTKSCHRQM